VVITVISLAPTPADECPDRHDQQSDESGYGCQKECDDDPKRNRDGKRCQQPPKAEAALLAGGK
jgi:hypothetical protein